MLKQKITHKFLVYRLYLSEVINVLEMNLWSINMVNKFWDEDSLIEQRMQDRYTKITQQLGRLILADLADEVVACIGLALQEESKEALKIAKVMGLSQEDTYVMNWDFQEYKKFVHEENDKAQVSYLMEDYV